MYKNILHDSHSNIPESACRIARVHIDRLLDDAFSSPHIYVISMIAGAGFGKSCATASYIERAARPAAWMQISRLDNVTLRFWDRFGHLFQGAPELFGALEKGGFPDSLSAFYIFLRVFCAYLDKQGMLFTLVLDDLHLIHNEEILFFIEQLINAHLDNLKIIILSRSVPHLKSNLLLRADGIAIEERDLRMSEEETCQFLKERCAHIREEDIPAIYADTQGWIFGLELLCVFLGRRRNAYSKFDFHELMERELFARFSNQRQKLLIQISLIGIIPYSLMQCVLQYNHLMLDEMTELSIFIRYDRRNQLYYVHHLFLDFLEKKQHYLSAGEIHAVYRLAADWYYEHHIPLDALRYYNKCAHYEHMVEIIAPFLTRTSKDLNLFLLEILDSIPAAILDENPMLRVIYALKLLNSAQIDKAHAEITDLRRQYEQRPLTDETRSLLGEIYIISAFVSIARREDDFVTYFIQADAYLPMGSTLITNALPLNGGNYANIVKEPKAGEFERMETLIFQGLPHGARVMNGCGYGIEYLVAAEGAYHRRELKAAEQNAYKALYMAQQKQQYDIECMACFFLVRILTASGSYAKIASFINNFKTRVNHHISVYGFSLFDIVEGWFYAAIGKTDAIAKWITSDYENASFLSPLSSGVDRLIRARCLLVEERYAEMLALLDTFGDIYGIKDFLLGNLETAILKAIAHYYIKDTEAAAAYFAEAYALSKANGLIMLFIEFGPYMRTLTTAMLKMEGTGIPAEWLNDIRIKSTTYAKQLSSLLAEHTALHEQEKKIFGTLTKKELQILTCLHNGLTRKQIADTCNISVNTLKATLDNIYAKLGAQNRIEAIKIVMANHIL